jgi:hypothetical protein
VGEGASQALGQGDGVIPSGPPKKLETFVGLWIPPACREEVLGDLHEKYTGPWQYIALAMCVVPFVILSRICRTTDTLILLTEALLIYGSFLAGEWYTDKTLLAGRWGLWRLAIPTVVNLSALILERAWDLKTSPRALIQGAVFLVGVYFSISGAFASVMLVLAVEILFRPEANLPRQPAGAALWTEHRAEPAAIPWTITTRLLVAAAVITLAGLVVTGHLPGIANDIMFLAVVGLVLGGLVLKLRRK